MKKKKTAAKVAVPPIATEVVQAPAALEAPENKAEIQTAPAPVLNQNAAAIETTPVPPPGTSPVQAVSPDCLVVTGFTGEAPVYLPKSKVFLTRLTKSCSGPSGEKGFLKDSGWMVMGFPCTGSDGRIDWKGTNYLSPKMVSFLVDTNCAMAPLSPAQLQQMVTSEIGLNPTASMLAFNPFVVQYWEVLEHDDADVSFSIDLRSNKGLGPSWTAFQKDKPFKVLMVGRENAWVQGNFMYVVEADISHTNRNRFHVEVTNARRLEGDELSQIKTRCESLRPERECSKVF